MKQTFLTPKYLFKAMFNLPDFLNDSASSSRNSRDCISSRSAAGLTASFFSQKI